MNPQTDVRSSARWRVIVDNDFAGDPDGLVSLAHVMMCDPLEVVLITTSLLDPDLAALAGVAQSHTAQRGCAIVRELYSISGLPIPEIVAGAESVRERDNPAAAAIVSQSLSTDERPLLLLCGGPLTNVAAALRLDPQLAQRTRLVWIGGAADGASEYNRDTDLAAAEFVTASEMDVVEIPRETYSRLRYSLTEISEDLAKTSILGGWLADRLFDVPPFVTLHGSLTLGDSALACVAALEPGFDPSVVAGRRTLADVDVRLMWGDLLAQLRRHARTERPSASERVARGRP